MIQVGIQYSLQKIKTFSGSRHSVPSLAKAVIWESVYAICDSCHFFQTAGASVLLKTIPPLESVAEVPESLPWVTQWKIVLLVTISGTQLLFFLPTLSFLFSMW